jgi:uncharacterized integral membrane protein
LKCVEKLEICLKSGKNNVKASVIFIVASEIILKYLLTAIGYKPGGSSTVHIYTQTVHRTTQFTTLVGRLSRIRTQSSQTKINNELTA